MTLDFSRAHGIDAQAFGQPGQRTFRLRIVGSARESASVWMEKEHLQALTLAIKQTLSQLDYHEDPPAPQEVSGFPVTADHDFRVGRMGMAFDPSDSTVVLYTYEMGLEDDQDATLRVHLTLHQAAALSSQLDEIIAGGRPVCPLCGVAIDAGEHACIRANGHSRLPIPDDRPADEESE